MDAKFVSFQGKGINSLNEPLSDPEEGLQFLRTKDEEVFTYWHKKQKSP
jgi:hypothetical protein